MRRSALAMFACTAMLACGQTLAQPYNMTIAGYSPGGLLSTVGAGLDRALNAAYPGSTLTYQTGSGGLANAMLLDQNKVPLAIIQDIELNVAIQGKPPFKQPIKDLRLLFSPISPSSRFQITHFVASKEWATKNDIKTIADIAAKKPVMRIAVNRPGNLDGDVSLAVLAANGISQDDIRKWGGQVVRAASQEMTSLMLDRRLDMVSFGISVGHPRIRELENGIELTMLPIDEKIADKVAADFGGKPCTIKAGEYKFLAADTASICVGIMVIVRADMDEKLAYSITKGVTENLDKYKAAHRLLQQAVTLQTFTEKGLVPYHPGAERYYREKGLLK